jgi:hypothetical protein
MPINISKALVAKLPEAERPDVADRLWEKSKGTCFLCEEPLNRASDQIEADHDIPESEGGPTEIANLNLAHSDCNKAKRAAKSIPIRPFLKLKAFLRKHGPLLQYDGVLPHFGINPKTVAIDILAEEHGNAVRIELPDGTVRVQPTYAEKTNAGTFESFFVELPRDAIYNDSKVQPRAIKDGHAWRIYADLQANPLNEPPTLRVDGPLDQARLLMFDGQHKSVANWMMGRPTIAAKVYLGLSEKQAVRLVNSIQSGVPKLPLSPFELAAKMDQEWKSRLEEYEQVTGQDQVSEAGFIKWLPQIDRARGRSAFREALIQAQLDVPDLRVVALVKRAGDKSPAGALSINEGTLKNSLLVRLLKMEALDLKGDLFVTYRAIESENLAFLLNTLVDQAMTPAEGEDELSPGRVAAAKRMLYQAGLTYIAELLLRMFQHHSLGQDLGQVKLDDQMKARIQTSIARLVDHPVWFEDVNRDARMAAVKNALDKNQGAKAAFEAVFLDFPYVILGPDASAGYKEYWHPTV